MATEPRIEAKPSRAPTIRPAREDDMLKLAKWLRAECDGRRGFWSNWKIIYESFMDGRLVVLTRDDHEPIGFLANGKYEPLIMEVQPKHRGKGFGRMLAEQMIDYWTRRRRQRLEFEAIFASIPFWQHMGFELITDSATGLTGKRMRRRNGRAATP